MRAGAPVGSRRGCQLPGTLSTGRQHPIPTVDYGEKDNLPSHVRRARGYPVSLALASCCCAVAGSATLALFSLVPPPSRRANAATSTIGIVESRNHDRNRDRNPAGDAGTDVSASKWADRSQAPAGTGGTSLFVRRRELRERVAATAPPPPPSPRSPPPLTVERWEEALGAGVAFARGKAADLWGGWVGGGGTDGPGVREGGGFEDRNGKGETARTGGGGGERGEERRSMRRIAVLRPFGTRMAGVLPGTFDGWSDFFPCDLDRRRSFGSEMGQTAGEGWDNDVEVDVLLSFSQNLEDYPEAAENVARVLRLFGKDGDGDGNEGKTNLDRAPWSRCFRNVHTISAKIEPVDDIYHPAEAHRNPLWVNGPNRQFASSLRSAMSGEFGSYDAVFIMEGDCVPVRDYWLDSLLDEAEGAAPFAILGR